MASNTSSLSNFETLAATCLVDAGILTQKLKDVSAQKQSSDGKSNAQAEREAKELRTRLFESAQILLQAVTPPEYTLTQGLSTSVSV